MFCPHCGNELADEAYICVNCGRWVYDVKKAKAGKKETGWEAATDCDSQLTGFFLLAFAIACLTLIFAFFAVSSGEVRVYSDLFYDVYYDSYYIIDSPRLECNYEMAVVSIISGLVALGIGLTQLILGSKTTGALKLLILINFIFCIMACIVGICVMIYT